MKTKTNKQKQTNKNKKQKQTNKSTGKMVLTKRLKTWRLVRKCLQLMSRPTDLYITLKNKEELWYWPNTYLQEHEDEY